MIKRRKGKQIALLLIMSMLLQMLGVNASAADPEVIDYATTGAVTGAAVYYVGGAGASDDNSGISREEAFATLEQTLLTVKQSGAGDYVIEVLGNITVSQPLEIGGNGETVSITMVNAATGSAIIMRSPDYLGDIFELNLNSTLILGDKDGLYPQDLIFDGGNKEGTEATGCMINVDELATLRMYSGATIQNNGSFVMDCRAGGVYNAGTFDMYGGTIKGNRAYSAGGVYNYGLFQMYGGTITANSVEMHGAGLRNNNTAELHGGSITANISNHFGGGIYNYRQINIYDDFEISNNQAMDGGGIYNLHGIINMEGGIISGNQALVDGGGICGGRIAVYSGSIINNTAAYGGAIYSDDSRIILYGFTNIPAGEDNKNDIYLYDTPIYVAQGFNTIGTIALTFGKLHEGFQVIYGQTGAVTKASISKFKLLQDTDYIINENGYLEYIGVATNYYIGGAGADDSNAGTWDAPLATIEKALELNGVNACNIILQSDIVLSQRIDINGAVTIKSDGTQRTISSTDFDDVLFYISSSLTLGNKSNTDEDNLLILDGMNIEREYNPIDVDMGSALSIYKGVTLKNFRSDTAVIRSDGLFNLYGGIVTDCNVEVGLIVNMGMLNMYGGTISNNSSYGVYNRREMRMSGGSISNNALGQILNHGLLSLSGAPVISSSNAEINEINLGNGGEIELNSNLNLSGHYLLDMNYYFSGLQILSGDTETIRRYSNLFTMKQGGGNYYITSEGYLAYKGTPPTYYVNETNGSLGDGTPANPFQTIQQAEAAIGAGVGTIILKSDITAREPIRIKGTITLQSDGEVRTIRRAHDFAPYSPDLDEIHYNTDPYYHFKTDALIQVYGDLKLGNTDNSGNDNRPTLILDGGKDQGMINQGSLIRNDGVLALYSGVAIQNCKSFGIQEYLIHNEGRLTMYGGVVQNSEGEASGILNDAIFSMYGGTIRGNSGRFAGVTVRRGAFNLIGGTISENISAYEAGESCAGVAVLGGEFLMSGGSITNNSGIFSGVLLASNYWDELSIKSLKAGPIVTYKGTMIMSGGSITDNTGTGGSGVYVYFGGLLKMQGGHIDNNDGQLSGIISIEKGSLHLSGRAQVGSNDKIYLYQMYYPDVTISGPLWSPLPMEVVYISTETGEMLQGDYKIGERMLVTGSGYTLSQEDIEKFRLTDPNYGVNLQGKIGYQLTPDNVTVRGYYQNIYNGGYHELDVKVTFNSKILKKGLDYKVTYENNINAGQARVIVDGLGKYAGRIKNTYTIDKATVTGMITANPTSRKVKASENKTPQELMSSINVTRAEVRTTGGVMTLPVTWSLERASYSTEGITYTFIGNLSDENVDPNGFALYTHVVVKPDPVDGFGAIGVHNLLSQFDSKDIDEIKVEVTIPSSLPEGVMISVPLSAELLKAAKESGKRITILVKDETGRERYTWSFQGQELKQLDENTKGLDLALNITGLLQKEDMKKLFGDKIKGYENGLIIDFEQEGILPGRAKIRLYVGDQPSLKEGSILYLYHINPITGQPETLPFSSGCVVDKDGYVTIDILHCSDYLLLPLQAPEVITASLLEQIIVTTSKANLYVGGTKDYSTKVEVVLPPTLELIATTKDKTSSSIIGGVTVAYRSGNKKVATIDNAGNITAKAVGKAEIITTVTLFDGTKKTFKTLVTVKKPKISFAKYPAVMKVGETYKFAIEAYGLEAKNVVWSTSEKGVLTITKAGKVTARSKGTDYVVATIGNVQYKVKVIVK